MEFLSALWLPILVSGVAVFMVSSILHMLVPIHKGDFAQLPGEEEIMATMRAQGVRPGQYAMPYASSMKEMGSEAMKARYEAGPVAYVTVIRSGVPRMGAQLVQWFLYGLLVSLLAAYVGWNSLGAGAHYLGVFRVVGTVAILAYGVAYLPNSIWMGAKWSSTFKFVFDGVVYGLVTAGIFGWLWA